MTQKAKLLRLVKRKPGLTATQYTRLLGFKACKNPKIIQNKNYYYKPATILRELHRFVNQGELTEFWMRGQRKAMAWRFYPPPL